jgi:hypothetical protein
MSEDAIIKELHDIKDKGASRHGYDIEKMVRSLREQQDQSGREVVCLKPRLTTTGPLP